MDGILFVTESGPVLDPRVHHPKDAQGRPVPGLWICINGMKNNSTGVMYGEDDAFESTKGHECQAALRNKNGVYKGQNGGITAISTDNRTYVSLYYGSQTQDRWAVDQHMMVGNYANYSLWVLVDAHNPIQYGDADTQQVWDRFKNVQNRHSNYVQCGDQGNIGGNRAYESLINGSYNMTGAAPGHPTLPEVQDLLKPNFIGFCGQTSKGKTWFMSVDGVLFTTKNYAPAELQQFGFIPLTPEQQAILGAIEFAGGKETAAKKPRTTLPPAQVAQASRDLVRV